MAATAVAYASQETTPQIPKPRCQNLLRGDPPLAYTSVSENNNGWAFTLRELMQCFVLNGLCRGGIGLSFILLPYGPDDSYDAVYPNICQAWGQRVDG